MDEVNDRKACLHVAFTERKVAQFQAFLSSLGEALEYATDLGTSPWTFALQIEDAKDFRVSKNDLRWMIGRGWIATADRSESYRGEVDPEIDLGAGSSFIISNLGLEMLASHQSLEFQLSRGDRAASLVSASKPRWDGERHELTVLGNVVKRFRWPAANQEMILGVFEEERWPPRIDDPLPRANGLEPKRRLADTIKCLNRNQHSSLIRFRGDGTGEGVLWDLVTTPNPSKRSELRKAK